MKNIARIVGFAFTVLLAASGCRTMHKSDAAALQGRWTGREIGVTPDGPRHVAFSETQFEYHGADPNDWGKGTFIVKEDTNPKQLLVTLTDCGPKEYVGKTCCMIYKIEGGTLTATANEPGNPTFPASFDAPGARHMVFTRE